jgi:putative transposase
MPVEAHLVRGETAAPSLQQYVAHYHEERNHQGKQNRLLFPLPNRGTSGDHGIVRCKERLGGLLKYYEREAA